MERRPRSLRRKRTSGGAPPSRPRTIRTPALACVSCGLQIARALADCGSLRCHDCLESYRAAV